MKWALPHGSAHHAHRCAKPCAGWKQKGLSSTVRSGPDHAILLHAPPKHSRLLWEHWGRPKLHWFPGSHLLHLDRGEYLEAQAMFLRRLDFLPDT